MSVDSSSSNDNHNNSHYDETYRILVAEMKELKRGMEREFENFKASIRAIPGILAPFEHSALGIHILFPFVERILPTFHKFERLI